MEYRLIKAGVDWPSRAELHYKFADSAIVYEQYINHFSNLIQERQQNLSNRASAMKAREYING